VLVEALLGKDDGVGVECVGDQRACIVRDGGGRGDPMECFGGHDARVGRRH